MSFAGNTGHKSPFGAERHRQAKSPLPLKRSSCLGAAGARVQRAGPEAGNPRAHVQQSLFGKESENSSPVKVCQRRSAQAEAHEPTTPTKMSEEDSKENPRRDGRREEFSNLSKRRVATPIKTLKPAFGVTPPRSPQRPYLGSPKFQKVLQERPAFYNGPAAGEHKTAEAPKKEISIAELQERLKKFIQDENASTHSLEVLSAITSSARENLFLHHDHSPVQVAKGGVAFTTGAAVEGSHKAAHSPRPRRRLDLAQKLPGFGAASPSKKGGEMEGNGFQRTASSLKEADPLPRALQVSKGGVAFTVGACDELVPESTATLPHPNPVDFLDISEGVVPSRTAEVENGSPTGTLPLVTSAALDAEVAGSQEADQGCIEARSSRSTLTEVITERIADAATGGEAPEQEALQLGAHVGVEAREAAFFAVGLELEEEVDDDTIFGEEETENVEPWPTRLVKSVLLVLTVACLMGAMVLTSGSPGLLPKSLHTNPLATFARESCTITATFLPISVGIMGVAKEDESILRQPAVQLRMDFLSRIMLSFDASDFEGFADGYVNGYSSLSIVSIDAEVTKLSGLAQLRTVTGQFKFQRGRFFLDVAGVTRDSTTSDPSELKMTIATQILEPVEVDDLDVEGENHESQSLGTCPQPQELEQELAQGCSVVQGVEDVHMEPEMSDLEGETLQAEDTPVINAGEESLEVALISDEVFIDAMEVQIFSAALETEPHILSGQVSLSEVEVLPLEEAAHSANISVSDVISDAEISSMNDEVHAIDDPPITESSIAISDFSGVADVVDNLVHHVDELTGEMMFEPPVSAHQSEADVAEATAFEQETLTLPARGFPSVVPAIAVLVAALAAAAPFLLQYRKHTSIAEANDVPSTKETAPSANTSTFFPATETLYKPSLAPAAWPSINSVHDTHIPDKHELDAISSPLSNIRTPGKNRVQNYSSPRYGVASPAMSAPAVHMRPTSAHGEQKPSVSAQTWHYGTPMQGASGPYRKTATFVPSQSGMSTTSASAVSEINSVAESALSMGAEECENLGSFTTAQLISVNEGGGEQMKLTPVRRSQRIRNKAVSPLPARFADQFTY